MSSEDYSNSTYAPKRTMAPTTFGTNQSFDQYQYNETSTPQEYHTPYQPINTPQNAQTNQGSHEYSEYTGRPQSYMPPPTSTWNTEQEAHSKPAPKVIKPDPDARTRKSNSRGIHQNDGANDDIDLDNIKDKYERAKIVDKKIEQMIKKKQIMQVDGGDDDEDDEEDGDEKRTSAYEDEDELGTGTGTGKEEENLNDPDLDISDEDPATEYYVLCQFEKVTRVKNKRKCNLKAGVMHLNGKDYLFHKATGEFEW